MKRNVMLIALALMMSFSVQAETGNPIGLEISQNLESWVNNDLSSESFMSILNAKNRDLDKQVENWNQKYWKSRIHFLKGRILFEVGQKRSSIRELEKSMKMADESITLNETSEAWRTMSEAMSLLMMQKGFLYIVANSSKAQEQAERALELNPENARASLIIAQFLSNAPPIAGGDLDEGLSIMKSLLNRDDISKLDRFVILQSLSDVYEKEERFEEALLYCNEALDLYPGNERSLALKRKIAESS